MLQPSCGYSLLFMRVACSVSIVPGEILSRYVSRVAGVRRIRAAEPLIAARVGELLSQGHVVALVHVLDEERAQTLLRRHDLIARRHLLDVFRHRRDQFWCVAQHCVDLDKLLGLPWAILAVPIRPSSLPPSISSAAHDGLVDAFLFNLNALASLPFIGPRYKSHGAPPKFCGSARAYPFQGRM
ncbi:PIN domain-containing protein [Paraliomyxa miuraensis]|uniref:hypothetical protein n=1 Tax=Paraliomyxa miuraensis TaxID=376150 RepID=UPI00224D4F8B|nr:hypothetical protein [Paraliomyxa miuraensis]MCX4239159.1 hypothetical protein [Paraliomyxa miuraensis]